MACWGGAEGTLQLKHLYHHIHTNAGFIQAVACVGRVLDLDFGPTVLLNIDLSVS